MEFAWMMVAIGVWAFLLFGGMSDSIKHIANASARKAEAKARSEEHRTERARLELERAKFEHDKTLA
jgi:hypothetical protein